MEAEEGTDKGDGMTRCEMFIERAIRHDCGLRKECHNDRGRETGKRGLSSGENTRYIYNS